MSRVAVDFGTGNTVLARWNEETGRAETIEIPGVTCLAAPGGAIDDAGPGVHVAPSLIHYSSSETLIGAQVLDRELSEHADTVRWMKRGIAYGVSKRKKTAQGHKSPAEAGADLLRLLLQYASDRISVESDEFIFTAPVEAFEDFRDWLLRTAESIGVRRASFLDEATSAVLGHRAAVRTGDRFLIVDFGCGTLDASAVRVDLLSEGDRKAIQLGQAGCDLGGMDVDRWIAGDFCARHGLDPAARKRIEPALLARSESLKIALSGSRTATSLLQVDAPDGSAGPSTSYTRSCASCERSQKNPSPQMGNGCLGCILLEHGFSKRVRETIRRALENAAVKAALRREDLTCVAVTGGTSLLPGVRELLESELESKVVQFHPFDAVARGACRGLVAPILQHDYAIESYDAARRAYELKPLFVAGTEYPTASDAARLWAKGSYDGMTRIGIKIFEVSRVPRRSLDASLVDASGVLLDSSRVPHDCKYICLNPENPTFILADPPLRLDRDARRFLCGFRVDSNRRLLVTVTDHISGKRLLDEHPVVRL